jgi:phenylacetic acid degradation operon negative regulatory protein
MTQDSKAPFTARSVLASALLGEDPPELPVSHLVHLAGLFGINGNRARVALSRMASAGEVTTDGSGRYRLAGHLLDRRERQADSRRGATRPWEGRWRMVVVTTSGRPAEERSARRRRLGLARLAEQREGVWLRPDNIELRPDPAADPDVTLFTVEPDGDPMALAASLWDLDGWPRVAEGLQAGMAALPPTGPDDLAPGFVLSAAVLRHLQADPLLPVDLLPPGWPGTSLRRQYDRWDREYRRVLRHWGRTARAVGDGRAPPPRGP